MGFIVYAYYFSARKVAAGAMMCWHNQMDKSISIMKRLLLTLLVLFSFSFINGLLAATYMDGYIIKDGDTILCKIKTWSAVSGLTQSAIKDEIIIKDSTEKEVKYLPTEIQGFGFKYGKEQMTFVPRSLKEGDTPIFMRVILLGQNLNLYSFSVSETTVTYDIKNGAPTKKLTADKTTYVIEDAKKRTVLFEYGDSKNGKRMKEFFSDDPELLKLYLYKRPNFYQIPDFVFIANKQS